MKFYSFSIVSYTILRRGRASYRYQRGKKLAFRTAAVCLEADSHVSACTEEICPF